METYKFKTNINCSGCVAGVTPHLNQATGVETWNVDTANPSKVLTVETNGVTAEEVVAIVKKAGFSAEKI
ncbi:heavy-metal-associated domain-containing protein [Chitinophaga sp. Cy-1792]|uniref:heavy-metal-associated domain-containing protein n=1 Tax=Chitinophaga sp. Cy-1792 TaxID=2608339 RepID=UPI001423AE87|nr:heavy-metal-associated domain-containing protein [Chitinophaga sp. Cy-1792]NIG53360.1 heavy-metal-associated domain-containing protein [Chitinophaga sp. Cy-1792]